MELGNESPREAAVYQDELKDFMASMFDGVKQDMDCRLAKARRKITTLRQELTNLREANENRKQQLAARDLLLFQRDGAISVIQDQVRDLDTKVRWSIQCCTRCRQARHDVVRLRI